MFMVNNWRISRSEAEGYCNKCDNLSCVVVIFIREDGKERKLNLCNSHLEKFILELNSIIEKALGGKD